MTEKIRRVIVLKTRPLFWPIAWIFLCLPIGLIWTGVRLHENSKITGNKIPRNVFLIIVAIFILLLVLSFH